MIVANPIYDAVFKRLMENTSVAKGLLSRIMGEKIISLEFRPQEYADRRDYSITLMRIDFSAIIETESGERKNVLIEVQKAKLSSDLMRFRNYLGSHYKKGNERNDGLDDPLPIVTIYFLNFCLNPTFPKVIQVARSYKDAVTGAHIKEKNDFIEALTHDSYIIQIPLLDNTVESELESALSVFNQKYIIEGNKHRLLLEGVSEQDDELLKEIARELERSAADKELERAFELEDEDLYGKRKDQKALAEALKEKEIIEEEKREALAREKEAVAREQALIEKLKAAGIDPNTT